MDLNLGSVLREFSCGVHLLTWMLVLLIECITLSMAKAFELAKQRMQRTGNAEHSNATRNSQAEFFNTQFASGRAFKFKQSFTKLSSMIVFSVTVFNLNK